MDNKTIIDNLAREVGLGKEKVQLMLSEFYNLLADHCLEMDSLIVPGFGQFEPKKRKERLSVHPASGKRLLVPPKLVLGFRPSGVLKNRVN